MICATDSLSGGHVWAAMNRGARRVSTGLVHVSQLCSAFIEYKNNVLSDQRSAVTPLQAPAALRVR
jgi:hypothetical protein